MSVVFGARYMSLTVFGLPSSEGFGKFMMMKWLRNLLCKNEIIASKATNPVSAALPAVPEYREGEWAVNGLMDVAPASSEDADASCFFVHRGTHRLLMLANCPDFGALAGAAATAAICANVCARR